MKENQITPDTLGLLLFLKKNTHKNEYIRDIIKQYFFEMKIPNSESTVADGFEKLGLLYYIKGSKNQELWDKARITAKGKKYIDSFFQEDTHPLTEFMLDYLCEAYERIQVNKSLITTGNRIKENISSFLYYKENYTEKMIRAVIDTYVSKYEYDKTYIMKTSNLVFKPDSVFTRHWSPEMSPLCNFIETNKKEIKDCFLRLK